MREPREPIILWEGDCAYVERRGAEYDVVVFSTNCVTHAVVRTLREGDRAEQICRRLNAYPANTRRSFGLL